jgi:hypothetical protein
MGAEYYLTRNLFLRVVGLVYLVAFCSYYIQFPGLFGCDGLEPIVGFLNRVQLAYPQNYTLVLPTALWVSTVLPVHLDVLVEVFTLVGIVFSILAAVRFSTAPVFALLWVLYASLAQTGQTFLSFQVCFFLESPSSFDSRFLLFR